MGLSLNLKLSTGAALHILNDNKGFQFNYISIQSCVLTTIQCLFYFECAMITNLLSSILTLCPLVLAAGLYGHTAVYHEQTDAVYVFGGYRFHVEAVEPSGELYTLYYPNLTWSLLVPSQGNKVIPPPPPPPPSPLLDMQLLSPTVKTEVLIRTKKHHLCLVYHQNIGNKI